jgi:hypothetical protein
METCLDGGAITIAQIDMNVSPNAADYRHCVVLRDEPARAVDQVDHAASAAWISRNAVADIASIPDKARCNRNRKTTRPYILLTPLSSSFAFPPKTLEV